MATSCRLFVYIFTFSASFPFSFSISPSSCHSPALCWFFLLSSLCIHFIPPSLFSMSTQTHTHPSLAATYTHISFSSNGMHSLNALGSAQSICLDRWTIFVWVWSCVHVCVRACVTVCLLDRDTRTQAPSAVCACLYLCQSSSVACVRSFSMCFMNEPGACLCGYMQFQSVCSPAHMNQATCSQEYKYYVVQLCSHWHTHTRVRTRLQHPSLTKHDP